jgi:hypothetical protein
MNRLVLLLAPALLAGCVTSPTPRYDMRFGDAVRQARQAQTINAQPSTAALDGMDGVSARNASERYHDSFRKPPPTVNVINIGGSLAPGAPAQ